MDNTLNIAGLAALLFGEVVTLTMIAAIACVTVRIMPAIFFGKNQDNQHLWEMNRGLLSVGIGLGVLAALAQAVGSLAAKPALVNGGDQTWLCGAVPIAVQAPPAKDDKMSREVEPARSGLGLSQVV